jgi:hypothetical protein
MANAAKYVFGAGLAYGQVFVLNSAGLPAATSVALYEGFPMPAPSTMTVSQGSPEYVPVIAHDQKLGQHMFPTTDPLTMALTLAKKDADFHAAITNTKVRTLHEAILTGEDTNQEGNEPSVAIVVTSTGLPAQGARWQSQVFRYCTLTPIIKNAEGRTAAGYVYNGEASRYTKYLTGQALTSGTDGNTSEAVTDYFTNNRLWFAAFLADGTEDEYAFHADRQAADTASMGVYVDGVERTASITKATDKITFTGTLPTANQVIVVQYQLASTAIVIV